MGYYVIADERAERAVVYDSTNERALPPGFIGGDARVQAESFLAFLHTRAATDGGLVADDFMAPPPGRFPNKTDPRSYSPQGLEKLVERWRRLCLNPAGELTPYGWSLSAWHDSERGAPPPEPTLAQATT